MLVRVSRPCSKSTTCRRTPFWTCSSAGWRRRSGRGVRGAALRTDDVVEHLFATTNHQWILFFTNKGRVYRAKAWQLPEAGRDAQGGPVGGPVVFPSGGGNGPVVA